MTTTKTRLPLLRLAVASGFEGASRASGTWKPRKSNHLDQNNEAEKDALGWSDE